MLLPPFWVLLLEIYNFLFLYLPPLVFAGSSNPKAFDESCALYLNPFTLPKWKPHNLFTVLSSVFLVEPWELLKLSCGLAETQAGLGRGLPCLSGSTTEGAVVTSLLLQW